MTFSKISAFKNKLFSYYHFDSLKLRNKFLKQFELYEKNNHFVFVNLYIFGLYKSIFSKNWANEKKGIFLPYQVQILASYSQRYRLDIPTELSSLNCYSFKITCILSAGTHVIEINVAWRHTVNLTIIPFGNTQWILSTRDPLVAQEHKIGEVTNKIRSLNFYSRSVILPNFSKKYCEVVELGIERTGFGQFSYYPKTTQYFLLKFV